MGNLIGGFVRYSLLLVGVAFLFSCSTSRKIEGDAGPTHKIDWTQVKPVIPKVEKKSPYGNPRSYEQFGKTYYILKSANDYRKKGVASWYGTKFHGRRTSSGEAYDMLQLTAAHKTLPIPCYVRVTNLDNGKILTVRVNDRGPFVKSRIIDLSYAAAHKLGMAKKGTANVIVESVTIAPSGVSIQSDKPVSSEFVRAKNVSPKQGKHRYVQVGAYANHKSAQTLAKVLDREIKLPVKITSVKRGSKNLYRVRIGPIDSLALAEKLAETLNISELGKPSIVYQD